MKKSVEILKHFFQLNYNFFKGITMCQMKVMLDKEGQQELVMEDVARLEVVEGGIKISTLFEEPKLISDVAVKKIDFLSGTATLQHKSSL